MLGAGGADSIATHTTKMNVPTFNTTLWQWQLNGSYCSPEKALSMLGMDFYRHLQELARAAGFNHIMELEAACRE